MFEKITEKDLQGKGVIGLPDTPALTTQEMQEKFEETAHAVLVPAHNALIEALKAPDAAAQLGMKPQGGLEGGTVAAQIQELSADRQKHRAELLCSTPAENPEKEVATEYVPEEQDVLTVRFAAGNTAERANLTVGGQKLPLRQNAGDFTGTMPAGYLCTVRVEADAFLILNPYIIQDGTVSGQTTYSSEKMLHTFANAPTGTAEGPFLKLSDVSPLPQTLELTLTGDAPGVSVYAIGKDLWKGKSGYTTEGSGTQSILFTDEAAYEKQMTFSCWVKQDGVQANGSALVLKITGTGGNQTFPLVDTGTATGRRAFEIPAGAKKIELIRLTAFERGTAELSGIVMAEGKPAEYPAEPDGSVPGVQSIYPETNLSADAAVVMRCTYIKEVSAGGRGEVYSVNGMKGAVELEAKDIPNSAVVSVEGKTLVFEAAVNINAQLLALDRLLGGDFS